MKLLRWVLIGFGILGLITVRVVEARVFYDPFITFFKSANRHAVFPAFDWWPLILNYIFRFLLNLIFSLAVLQLLFKNKRWTLQAGVLLLLVFVITLPLYLYCIYTEFEVGYLFSFYMRRFVIQPITLLLIIPMFYYRQHLSVQDR